MTYSLFVRKSAKADVRKAARWYELQCPGLGRDFVNQVDTTLNRLTGNLQQYQVLYREVRRAIIHQFPYGVYYRIEADRIIVFCVTDLRQEPSTWKSRIPKS